MAKSREQELQNIHNYGQRDGAAGHYDPPHSLSDRIVTELTGAYHVVEMVHENNEKYDERHNNGWNNRR